MANRFLIEKYNPKSLSELTYNDHVTNVITSIAQTADFPHLIFYGPEGSGKKTRIKLLLQSLFDQSVYKLNSENKELKINSKTIAYTITSSPYHIEITPSDSGIYDRHIIQHVIKEAASFKYFSATNKEFKVKSRIIVVKEADKLTKDAQSALRRTMEKYMSNCRLIMCCNYISKIISPIRSRCAAIRVEAPTFEEIGNFLNTVIQEEKLVINQTQVQDIIKNSGRDMRKALNSLQLSKF